MGVPFRGSTYLNLIYLMLAFPLGLFYFIFLVVGFALGFGLLIIWVGLPVLLLVFLGWWSFAAFERQMAILMLREEIPPMSPNSLAGQERRDESLWSRVIAHLTNPVTWTSLLYLFLKFPLGILSFVMAVTLLAVTAVFLTAPVSFWFVQPEIWFTWNQVWRIDTLGDAIIAFLVGLPLLLVSLHILNGFAWISGKFARVLLGSASALKTESTPEAGIITASPSEALLNQDDRQTGETEEPPSTVREEIPPTDPEVGDEES